MSIASEITALNNNLAAAKNAVTTAGGTVGDTGLAGLATEIASIPTGGGGSEKEVKFFDYDGTVVAEYTLQEAQNLSALPTAPTHENLEFVEWTETLAYVNALTGPAWIGATYQDAQSHGNDTVIYFYPYNTSTVYTLRFSQDVENGVSINWGDGSATETVAGTGFVSATHTYSTLANAPYTIRVTPAEGVNLVLGSSSGSGNPFFNGQSANYCYGMLVVGRCSIGNYGFYGMDFCKDIVLSNKISSVGYSSFGGSVGSQSLYCKAIIFPNNVTFDVGTYGLIVTSQYMEVLVMPSSCVLNKLRVSSYSMGAPVLASNITDLSIERSIIENIRIPDTITKVSSLQFCQGTRTVTIPANVTTIDYKAFRSCYSLERVIFEDRASLDTFSSSTFEPSNVYFTLRELDFTDFTQVPTIGFYSLLNGLPKYTKILVPAALEESWKAATTWKNYKDQIVGV